MIQAECLWRSGSSDNILLATSQNIPPPLPQRPLTSSIILTIVTMALPGSSAGAQSSWAGSNMLMCHDPWLNSPIEVIRSVTRPKGKMTHPLPRPNLLRYSNQLSGQLQVTGCIQLQADLALGSSGGVCHLTYRAVFRSFFTLMNFLFTYTYILELKRSHFSLYNVNICRFITSVIILE